MKVKTLKTFLDELDDEKDLSVSLIEGRITLSYDLGEGWIRSILIGEVTNEKI